LLRHGAPAAARSTLDGPISHEEWLSGPSRLQRAIDEARWTLEAPEEIGQSPFAALAAITARNLDPAEKLGYVNLGAATSGVLASAAAGYTQAAAIAQTVQAASPDLRPTTFRDPYPEISTPYEVVHQSLTPDALEVRAQIEESLTTTGKVSLYRTGSTLIMTSESSYAAT
jgi:hypothetical protein